MYCFRFLRMRSTIAKNMIQNFAAITRNYSDNQLKRYKVNILPALMDNYMYLIIDKAEKSAIAIDPVEPVKIFDSLKMESVSLKAVLTTHHHADHAGGNELLLETMKNIPIFGGDDRIEALTNKLSHNEVFKIANFSIKCLHTPCHTSGHVCYFFDSEEPICFTGDTLFIGGCGRFFEGSAEHMFKSLNILKSLPLNTKLYCGHEYTLSNLKFALHVESDNPAIKKRIKSAEESLKQNVPTVPSTLEDELSFNPFLRADCESLKSFTKQSDPISVIRVLRELKDKFKS